MTTHSNRFEDAVQQNAPWRAGALFDIIWVTLADLLGDAATAALVQRAIQGAASRDPELAAIRIHSERFEHRYVLPESWVSGGGGLEALRELMRELQPLLTALTGEVVLERLRAIPDLTLSGLLTDRESAA